MTNQQKTKPATPDSAVVEGHFVAICFFRPQGFYSNLIAWLQTLVGYCWNDPTHVGVWYKGFLYEMTAAGFDKRQVSLESVTKVSYHVTYLFDCGNNDDFETLEEELETCNREQWHLSLASCVLYCFRVLVLNRNRPLRFFVAGNFGTVFPVPGSKSLYFAPPASCTSPVWNSFSVINVTWDIFTPASLYRSFVK